MRILFGHQRFGVQAFGGVSRYFCELASGLSRISGVHPSIFAPLHVNHYLKNSPLLEPWSIFAPPFRGSGLPLGAVNLLLSKLLVRRSLGVDVYHETYYTRFDSKPGNALRVVTVFDMIHELFPGDFRAHDRTRQIKRISIERADHLICISESTRSDLIRIMGVPAEKTSVVYLGSSLSVGAGDCIAAPSPNCRPYLLYVGGRAGYKNFSRFVHAYANSEILKREFRIVCFGGGAISASELSEFSEIGLSVDDVVHMTGSDHNLTSAYVGAAMLVYPSLYEGFGLPPLEAMSIGCPVVCANASSIPEIVGDAGQYFDPSDVDSIRHAIEEVACSPSRASELIVLGRRRSASFNWDRCASETLGVYRNLIGSDRRATAVS